jgi:hypothetical protein
MKEISLLHHIAKFSVISLKIPMPWALMPLSLKMVV